ALFVAVAVAANEPRLVYRSADGGKTWRVLDVRLPGNRELPFRLSAGPDSVLVVGSGAEVYGSSDFGSHWKLLYEFPVAIPGACEDTYPRCEAVVVLDSGVALVKSSYGLIQLTDLVYNPLHNPIDYLNCLLRSGSGECLAGGNGFMRSTNRGITWD